MFLFGSGLSNDFDQQRSDLDFLVEFEAKSPSDHANGYFGLMEDLEQLLGVPVDLIEPGPISNPYFREEIEKTRRPIYEAPEIRKYLFDIWQACELLAQFSSGKTLNDYRGDALLRSAIERQFEIVGEALNQAIKVDPELANHVSDSGRIIAFRNRLIHA